LGHKLAGERNKALFNNISGKKMVHSDGIASDNWNGGKTLRKEVEGILIENL